MVNGVKMVFSKAKMLARIEAEGKMEMVNAGVLAIMDNLDGQEVSSACWNRQVNGDPVYACKGKDGKVYDVFEGDCV